MRHGADAHLHEIALVTEYRVLERFAGFTFLEIRLGTGRTHQIRVHMADLGHPIAGDRLYTKGPSKASGAAAAGRMFLHAWRIGFLSPAISAQDAAASSLSAEDATAAFRCARLLESPEGQRVTVEAPLPGELEQWLELLRITLHTNRV